MNDLDRYQQDARTTAIYPGKYSFSGIVYCALKLNGEAGEVAEKIGKVLRDDEGNISSERREALLLELGDVMWYVANLAAELNFSLHDVAEANLQKLAGRKLKGILQGSGDNR